MVLRVVAIIAIASAAALRTLPAALALRLLRGRTAARRLLYRRLVQALEALGPTFVKFGQVAATRADALPPELCRELARLHDSVRPMSRRQAVRALRAAVRERPALAAVDVDPQPIGAGSIACVYRGVLADGSAVALKLKRPRIDARMRSDIALLRGAARAGQRLPKLRGMPIADLVGYVGSAIVGQLDFERESRYVETIRGSLLELPDVRVPRLHRGLSSPRCLVFEYLPGLDVAAPQALAEPVRARLAGVVLAAVHKLFFEDGLVHCDLHPGNLYLTADEQVVILDAGYCVQLPDRVRGLIGEFFACLAAGDGARCGAIVLDSAIDAARASDPDGFVAEVAALVTRTRAEGFAMPAFGDAIYELQQRHGIYAASDFAFPLMSLLVVERTLHAFSPRVDFQTVGRPPAAAAAAF
jgi:ubiquinone biosynthesis protein